jgi:hypothetical protein
MSDENFLIDNRKRNFTRKIGGRRRRGAAAQRSRRPAQTRANPTKQGAQGKRGQGAQGKKGSTKQSKKAKKAAKKAKTKKQQQQGSRGSSGLGALAGLAGLAALAKPSLPGSGAPSGFPPGGQSTNGPRGNGFSNGQRNSFNDPAAAAAAEELAAQQDAIEAGNIPEGASPEEQCAIQGKICYGPINRARDKVVAKCLTIYNTEFTKQVLAKGDKITESTKKSIQVNLNKPLMKCVIKADTDRIQAIKDKLMRLSLLFTALMRNSFKKLI